MPLQPKKSRILASTSRQGNRQSRVQVERSEDEDGISEAADTAESGAEDESQEPGTSPTKKKGQIGQIMESVVDAVRSSLSKTVALSWWYECASDPDQQRNRRKMRKENVLKSYDDAYTAAQSSIATLFDEHEKQS